MTSPLKKGKKACTECRQQKAKCDVYLNPGQPCSRCRKVKADCVISDPFKREHKRKRLSELEHEADELRRKLRSSQSVDPHPSPIALLTAAAEMGVHAELPERNPPLSQSQPAPALGETSAIHATRSRTLNGVEVTGQEVDDLFHLFFHHYAQFLPILDPQTRPNTYYTQSPFLFWSVIGISCRTYSQNPTLLMALSRSIMEMALLSIVSGSPPWHTIQGLLLLLTWNFPKDDRPDVTFTMSGMLLHIAMQNGLHIPMSSHEFSRVKIPAPSEADMVQRSELWAHCVIVYQRACVMKGQSPRALVSLAQDPAQRQVLLDKVAPYLVLKLRCQELIARCSEAVLENGVRTMSLDQERALDILLRTFEGQVSEMELQAVTEDERFHSALCRMAIQIFHLYKNQTLLSSGCLPRLLATACSMIDSIQTMANQLGFIAMAPVQVAFGLLLASTSLLRILKSAASHGLDTARARSAIFSAINLAKQMSVESTDIAAKTATVLKQLWNSSKAFRKADGSEYIALRIRSRLVLSPVLDAVWWWRDEFEPQARAMVVAQTEPADGTVLSQTRCLRGTDAGGLGVDANRESVGGALSSTVAPAERQEPFHLDEQFFADFEWALSEDALFSLEPLPTTWPVANNLL